MGRLIAAAVALVATVLVLNAAPASAQESDEPLRVTVTVDGADITGRTVELDPGKPAELSITAVNPGSAPVKVRLVRVSGVALALTFYAYDTTLPFEVPARGQTVRTFPLDVRDLDGQAIGLLPTSVELLSEDRTALGGASTVADVRGSYWSVYGVFGLALVVLTAVTWAGALLALARHRLSRNRFRRALRFLPAGVGTGLVAVVTLSVLRLVPPEPAVEIPIVLGAAVIALLLGFLTPHPTPAGPPAPADQGDRTVDVSTQYIGVQGSTG
ncbi:hypothetical protein [Actinokineospora iranica]|uniref:Uncharacterized protein n=1 Tax=Actinokineospora iranica TaxID=1271860 RepID=A0A1G6XYN5_9PSEU|nr:hypothetical protein [Actinokineospora iranica]SDD82505.1 hypothetical protein SAMN05216174_11937 [Actinokineospora iranica]